MHDVERVRAIADLERRAAAIKDLTDATRTVDQAIRDVRAETVQQMRDDGWSHQQVADAFGVHRNRAQQIAEGRSGGHRRREANVEPDEGE